MIDLAQYDLPAYDSINDLRRQIGDWVKEHFRIPVLNTVTNWPVQFNKDSRHHPVTSLAPGRVADLEEARLLTTLSLRQALAEARYDHPQPKKPTDAPDVLGIHIFLANVRLAGVAYLLRLLVKEKTTGYYFYDHIVARA